MASIQALRTIFIVSVLATAFWVLGLVWDTVFRREPAVPALLLAASGLATAVSWLVFRGDRLKLQVSVTLGELLRVFVPRLVGAYLVSVPIVAGVMFALSLVASDQSDAAIAIPLMAVWLPLWFAPALGAEWSWRSMQKQRPA